MALPLALSTNYKADGPLGGFLAGLQDSFSLANADRDLVKRDFELEREKEKHAEYMADSPLRAIERANKIAEQELLQDDYQSGRKRELSVAEYEAKLQETIAKKSASEVQNMYSQAQTMLAMNEAFGAVEPKDYLEGQARWDEIVKLGEKTGIKMPKQYSPQALAQLRKGAKVAMNTLPFLQKNALMDREQSHELAMLNQKQTGAERLAQIEGGYRVQAAGARPSPQTQDDRIELKPITHRLELEFEELRREGKPLPENKVKQYIAHSAQKDNDIARQEEADARRLQTQLMSNKTERKRLADKHGVDERNIELIATMEAAARAKEAIIRREMMKFEGDRIKRSNGRIDVIQNGKMVPESQAGSGANIVLPGEEPAAPTPTPALTPEPTSAPRPAPTTTQISPQEVKGTIRQPDPMEGMAAFGLYPRGMYPNASKTGASAQAAGMSPSDAALLQEAAARSANIAANDRVRTIGEEYLSGQDRPNRVRELAELAKRGKIPRAERSKKYQRGDVVITASGRLAVFNGKGWDAIR